jgi:hypothetical protein
MTTGSYGLLATKYGPNVGHADPVEVAKKMAKEHKPDTRLNLRELAPLERDRNTLVDRIADRKRYAAQLAPVVAELRRKLSAAIDELTELTAHEQAAELRLAIATKKRDIERIESAWVRESKALAVCEAVITGTERKLSEFDALNGDRLKKLRELDKLANSNRKQPYRASGDRHEAGIASTF